MQEDLCRQFQDRLWARQDGESDRAFEAFAAYRDLGPARSAVAVAKTLGKSKALIERWSSAWGWVERASAWDDEADRLIRERDLAERQEARRLMLAQHARVGQTLVRLGEEALASYDLTNPDTADAARAKLDALKPTEAARLMEIGVKIERHARGEGGAGMREALAWTAAFVDLALGYLPSDAVDAFLADVDDRLGMGRAA